MIVHGMSEEEMKKELLADMASATRWEDANSKFRRVVLKSRKFPIINVHKYKSPRKNNWLIILEARAKNEHDNYRITYITTLNSDHGIYAIMVSFINKIPCLNYYSPHFFKRYKERMNLDLTGIDLIAEYFKYNHSLVLDYSEKDIGNNIIMMETSGTSEDGVALGFVSESANYFFKTFITYEMLKGEQISKYTENNKIRQEIYETL